MLRYAKANQAAGEAHRAGPTLADAPSPGALFEEVTAAIAAYPPEKKNRGSWAELAELACRLTLGSAPPSPGNATSTATHVAAFLRWFRTWPVRADVNAPWTPGSFWWAEWWRPACPFAPGSRGSRATLGRRRNMAFLVGLGLGAGLDGHDLKTVTRADLVDAATTAGRNP